MSNQNEQNGIIGDGINNHSNKDPNDSFQEEIKKKKKIELNELINRLSSKTLENGDVLYSLDNKDCFTDTGSAIHFGKKINSEISDEQILSLILFAKEKYNNSFKLTGTDDFKERAIKLIVDNNISVNLKDPSQYALFNKLNNEKSLIKNGTSSPLNKKQECKKENSDNSNQNQELKSENAGIEKSNEFYSSEAIYVNKLQQWELQNSQNNNDIGKKPNENEFFWSDLNGYPLQGNPIDFEQFYQSYKQEEIDMTNKNKILAAKGTVERDNVKTDRVLLWKNEDQNFLSGIMLVGNDNKKINVVVFPQKRKDNDNRFLTVSQIVVDQNGDTHLENIGNGNAINHKKGSTDGIEYNELIFSITPKGLDDSKSVLTAKTTHKLDDEFHQLLGFKEKDKTKPKNQEANTEKNSKKENNSNTEKQNSNHKQEPKNQANKKNKPKP